MVSILLTLLKILGILLLALLPILHILHIQFGIYLYLLIPRGYMVEEA